MTDQLLGWLGQADAVLTILSSIVGHLDQLFTNLTKATGSGVALWLVLRPVLRACSMPLRRVITFGRRVVRRPPRSNNQR